MRRRNRTDELLGKAWTAIEWYSRLGVRPLSVLLPYRVVAYLRRQSRTRKDGEMFARGVPVVAYGGNDVAYTFPEAIAKKLLKRGLKRLGDPNYWKL